MEEKVVISLMRKVILKIIYWLVSLLIFCNAMIILQLHLIVPFFPVLFLFNFCFWFGYPLFLECILKKQWFKCTKDDYLALKYILFPWLIMEICLMFYYFHETLIVLRQIAER